MKDIQSVEEFENYVLANKETLFVVDFWASWCGPCLAFMPTLESVETKLDDNIEIVKVSVEEVPKLSQIYKVKGIPTLIFIKKGDEVDRITGAPSEDHLLEKIENLSQ